MTQELLADPSRHDALKREAAALPSWGLTPRQLCELELPLNGGFAPLAQDVGILMNSPEFVTAYGGLNNNDFVNQLYLNLLQRPAQAGELTSGLSLLTTGQTRGEVTLSLTESQEYQIKTIGQIDQRIHATDAHFP